MQWHKRIIPALWNAETTGWQDQTQNESCLNIIFLKAWHESQCEGPGFSAHYISHTHTERHTLWYIKYITLRSSDFIITSEKWDMTNKIFK